MDNTFIVSGSKENSILRSSQYSKEKLIENDVISVDNSSVGSENLPIRSTISISSSSSSKTTNSSSSASKNNPPSSTRTSLSSSKRKTLSVSETESESNCRIIRFDSIQTVESNRIPNLKKWTESNRIPNLKKWTESNRVEYRLNRIEYYLTDSGN